MSALSKAKHTSPTPNSSSIKDSANRSNLKSTKHLCHKPHCCIKAIHHTRVGNTILTSPNPTSSYPLISSMNTIKLTSSVSLSMAQSHHLCLSSNMVHNMPGYCEEGKKVQSTLHKGLDIQERTGKETQFE